eukprot:2068290-Amphidinium_carterae.1
MTIQFSHWLSVHQERHGFTRERMELDVSAKVRTTAVGLEVVESSHTAFVDRLVATLLYALVMDAVGRRIRQIVSFGAGFDCRPYRLDVPPQLKIVEVSSSGSHISRYRMSVCPHETRAHLS